MGFRMDRQDCLEQRKSTPDGFLCGRKPRDGAPGDHYESQHRNKSMVQQTKIGDTSAVSAEYHMKIFG